MRKYIAVIIILLMSMTAIAQDDLLPTGKDGMRKRSWVLMDTNMTVRGEKTITLPSSALKGNTYNYVAFYVKNELVGIDEIPPYEVTHDFGNYTRKAKIMVIGVKYQLEEMKVVENPVGEETEEPAGNQALAETEPAEEVATTDDIQDGAVSILSPLPDSYAYGMTLLKADINLPVKDVLRIDFLVDGNDAGSVSTPPYEVEYDFGRGFAAHQVRAVAVLNTGRTLESFVQTTALEESDFYVSARLVTLEATVVDYRDRLIGDLKQEEFKIYEDGEEQEVTHFAIEERPLRVAILLDSSGSMNERNKMKWAKDAAKGFLGYLNPRQDKAALIAFTDLVNLLSGFSDNIVQLRETIDRIEPIGGTAIIDSLDAVVPLFEEEIGRKAIILLTDGIDMHSNVQVNEAVEKVRAAGIKVFTIGVFEQDYFTQRLQESVAEKRPMRSVVPDVDPEDARKKNRPFKRGDDYRTVMFEGFSDETGGAAFFPKKPEELPRIFKRIADELRNMYTLGYVSTNKKLDGEWREVEVETERSGATVRTKRGYYGKK